MGGGKASAGPPIPGPAPRQDIQRAAAGVDLLLSAPRGELRPAVGGGFLNFDSYFHEY